MPSRPEQSPVRRRAVRSDALFNREKILAAAAETLATRGQNVPLAEIAGAAGVGVGTLYRGFPDRTALMHALELNVSCPNVKSGMIVGESPEEARAKINEIAGRRIRSPRRVTG